jgi:hypothetical protein
MERRPLYTRTRYADNEAGVFLSRFISFQSFRVFWGLIGLLIVIAWIRFLLEPKRSAASVGMSRTRALRTLLGLSAFWYVVWGTAHGLMYLIVGR